MTKMVDIRAILERYGAQNIRSYILISNSGYVFDLDGGTYDLRHWRNIYGAQVDHYSYIDTSKAQSDTLAKLREILEEIKKELKEAQQ